MGGERNRGVGGRGEEGEGEGAEKQTDRQMESEIDSEKARRQITDARSKTPTLNKDSLFVCWLVAYRPSNMRVYLRDGSAQTVLRAATLR